MCFIFWQVRGLPSGLPIAILFTCSLAGAVLEFALFLFFRRAGSSTPFGASLILAAVFAFLLSRLLPGAAWYFLCAFFEFKFFSSPLALIPLLKDR